MIAHVDAETIEMNDRMDFFDKIVAFFKKIFGVNISVDDIKILEGDYYDLRIIQNKKSIKQSEIRDRLRVAKLSYHRAEELYYWAEAVKKSDIPLEGTDSFYKVRYISLSVWSLVYKVPFSSVPKDEARQRQYTHVFCVWEGGRFRSNRFVLGKHLVSIPLDLGVYGSSSAATIASEISKCLLRTKEADCIDWKKEVLKHKSV